MKTGFIIALAFFLSGAYGQTSKTGVMTLGTFHFNFPNLDVKKISKEDQVDVLEPKFQKEIKTIVNKIAVFRPTIIVIERPPSRQQYTDSIFNSYLSGNYSLGRNEEEQLGFRLAKVLGIKRLYCVDEWGNFNPKINNIINGTDSLEAKRFEAYYFNNPDKPKFYHPPFLFKTKGITAALQQMNDKKNVKKSLGNYLLGAFKYESEPNDFTGVDFETGRWFNRNLKIFRNIQRIPTGPSDRILIIFGAGHLNLLNYFFDCSPEYLRVDTNIYLK